MNPIYQLGKEKITSAGPATPLFEFGQTSLVVLSTREGWHKMGMVQEMMPPCTPNTAAIQLLPLEEFQGKMKIGSEGGRHKYGTR